MGATDPAKAAEGTIRKLYASNIEHNTIHGSDGSDTARAEISFFFGQAKVIPEPIRIMPLLGLPVLAVLVTMIYWLWRIRVRKSLRGLTRNSPLEVI